MCDHSHSLACGSRFCEDLLYRWRAGTRAGSSSASQLVLAAPPATPKSAWGCSTGCRVDLGSTAPLLCRNQHPHPHERIRTPHSAGQLHFCQSLQAAEPLGTARARGRRGCVPVQPVTKVPAGCAARSRCRARPGSTNPPRAAAPSSFLALPSSTVACPFSVMN